MKKNEEYIVDIIDNGFQGEGIAKIDNTTVFVKGAIKDEKVKTLILKVDKNISYGKIVEIINSSKERVSPDCITYSSCGGCSLRHVNYDYSLRIKENAVRTTLRKTYGKDVEIEECIAAKNPICYRNKLQFPVAVSKDNKAVMGVFQERTHNIIETRNCLIQDNKSQEIANFIIDFMNEHGIPAYDEKTLSGTIRHIVIRAGKKTDEIMVNLVTNQENIPHEKELVEELIQKFTNIKTIVKNINNKNTNVILGKEVKVLYGEGFIYDFIGKYKFKISPLSFFQVNPVQTERLYSKAVEYADLKGNETIFDLYCGIGTIGIFSSDKAKKIYGIETIPEAIEDAKQNATLNNIENAEYFVGDVEKELPELIEKRSITPDVVFVDPPRKGCDKTAIDTLLKIESKRIVYVSCNPATLGRDLKLLEVKYELEHLSVCDMFPYTSHIECVCALKLRD